MDGVNISIMGDEQEFSSSSSQDVSQILDTLLSTYQREIDNETQFVYETTYRLEGQHSSISVGLSAPRCFYPAVKLLQQSKVISFLHTEWSQLVCALKLCIKRLNKQINKNTRLCSNCCASFKQKTLWLGCSISVGKKSVVIKNNKISIRLFIKDLSKLLEFEKIINLRLQMLENLKFFNIYDRVLEIINKKNSDESLYSKIEDALINIGGGIELYYIFRDICLLAADKLESDIATRSSLQLS